MKKSILVLFLAHCCLQWGNATTPPHDTDAPLYGESFNPDNYVDPVAPSEGQYDKPTVRDPVNPKMFLDRSQYKSQKQQPQMNDAPPPTDSVTPANPNPSPDTPANPNPSPDTPANPNPSPDTPANSPDAFYQALNLSAYELFMLTDLLIEIAVRPCNSVNRPVMSSLKAYLFDGLADAPIHDSQYPLFFANYKNLVNCLDEADQLFPKFKVLASAFFPGGSAPTPLQKQQYRRVRRGAESPYDNLLSKENPFLEHELSIIDEDLSFPNYFALLLSIVEQTCPYQKPSNMEFIFSAMSEVLKWISSDRSSYKTAQLKYFHNTRVIRELTKCDDALGERIQQLRQEQDSKSLDFDIVE